jgi:hypothetical protein
MSEQEKATLAKAFSWLAHKREGDAIQYRRSAIYADKNGPRELWGLALSGGGIRSATFCLGVLQALAMARFRLPGEATPEATPSPATGDVNKKPWPLLSRFDFLSTVSGGGYAGSFYSALFRTRQNPQAIKAALPPLSPLEELAKAEGLAKAAYKALATDPPGRLSKATTSLDETPDRPLRWLRENGRYLAPNNTGDLVYDIAIAIRNLCAVHYVVGITLLTMFLCMFAFRYGSLHFPVGPIPAVAAALEAFTQPGDPCVHGSVWLSPWLGILGIWIALVLVPCGVAYWLDQENPRFDAQQKEPRVLAPAIAAFGLLVVGVLVARFMWWQDTDSSADIIRNVGSKLPQLALTFFNVVLFLSLLAFALAKYFSRNNSRMFRARITRWLARALTVTLGLALLALIETAGQTLYLWLVTGSSQSLTVFSVVGAITAIAAGVRQFAPMLAQPGKDGLLSKLPLNLILGVVGLTLTLVLSVGWHCLATALLFGGELPPPTSELPMIEWAFSMARASASPSLNLLAYYPLALIVFCLIGVIAAGYFLGFVNLSSLQMMYCARLTRAYLGASNAARFEKRPTTMDVTESDPSDDFTRANYYDPGKPHLGPAHIINVTINATTGSGDQLTQRDRQGLPLAVTPAGVTVGGELQAAPRAAELSIGQWVGISGAAFSTGIGRGTSLGLAMLFFIINIRLGWWWDSGKADHKTRLPVWRNQSYLLREFRARFFGTDGSHWYLSDGGHFENTGVFELLRRRVGFIVSCDCGADPQYTFEDLANLMRLARIDFGAEFELIQPDAVPELLPNAEALAPYFAFKESNLGSAEKLPPGQDQKCALLYRVRYASSREGEPTESILLVLKPRLVACAPLDLFEYQSKNPSFPQQTTFDQFFDEAQWESYRKLGVLIGSRIFPA